MVTETRHQYPVYASKIGRGTYGPLTIVGTGDFNIGSFCSIAGDVKLVTWGHRTDWVTTYPFNEFIEWYPAGQEKIYGHPVIYGPLEIGSDVWIGQGVTIMGTVKIGSGSVIAAGAVVVKDVEPYSIIGGNPGKLIRKRFSDEDIEFLLKLKWWDKPNEEIKSIMPHLCTNDLSKLKLLYPME